MINIVTHLGPTSLVMSVLDLCHIMLILKDNKVMILQTYQIDAS